MDVVWSLRGGAGWIGGMDENVRFFGGEGEAMEALAGWLGCRKVKEMSRITGTSCAEPC